MDAHIAVHDLEELKDLSNRKDLVLEVAPEGSLPASPQVPKAMQRAVSLPKLLRQDARRKQAKLLMWEGRRALELCS